MHTIEAFFLEAWFPFLMATSFMALLQFGRRVSLEGAAAIFARPGSFSELSAFSREEQTRLFRGADREAFARWRIFLPVLGYAAVFTSGMVIARTVSEVSNYPDSTWMRAGLAGCVVALLVWL